MDGPYANTFFRIVHKLTDRRRGSRGKGFSGTPDSSWVEFFRRLAYNKPGERRLEMKGKEIAIDALAAFVCVGLVLGTACKGKSAQESLVENRIERPLEKATGGKVDLDLKTGTIKVKTAEGESVLTTGERVWPEDLPGDAIVFRPAKVRIVSRARDENGKNWTIQIYDFADDALEAYTKKLKDADWTIMSTVNSGKGGMVSAEKNGLQVNVIINAEANAGSVSFHQER
jgi:hypothetical protein